jgi:hypothetical protein
MYIHKYIYMNIYTKNVWNFIAQCIHMYNFYFFLHVIYLNYSAFKIYFHIYYYKISHCRYASIQNKYYQILTFTFSLFCILNNVRTVIYCHIFAKLFIILQYYISYESFMDETKYKSLLDILIWEVKLLCRSVLHMFLCKDWATKSLAAFDIIFISCL